MPLLSKLSKRCCYVPSLSDVLSDAGHSMTFELTQAQGSYFFGSTWSCFGCTSPPPPPPPPPGSCLNMNLSKAKENVKQQGYKTGSNVIVRPLLAKLNGECNSYCTYFDGKYRKLLTHSPCLMAWWCQSPGTSPLPLDFWNEYQYTSTFGTVKTRWPKFLGS